MTQEYLCTAAGEINSMSLNWCVINLVQQDSLYDGIFKRGFMEH